MGYNPRRPWVNAGLSEEVSARRWHLHAARTTRRPVASASRDWGQL